MLSLGPTHFHFSNRCDLSKIVDARWDLNDLCGYENRIASWLAAPSIMENVKFLPGNGRDAIIAFGVPLSQIKTRACFVTIEVWPRNESATALSLSLPAPLCTVPPFFCISIHANHLRMSGQIQKGLKCASRASAHRAG